MTFSIAGRCRRTGQFGIAVTTSSIAVGARCVWVREGVGAVATQNVTNPALGKLGLDLLERGIPPPEAMRRTVEADGDHARFRQLVLLGADGPPVVHTGDAVLPICGESTAADCAAAGNLLVDAGVAGAMTGAFERLPEAALAERLLAGLEAGLAAGGEHGAVRSAALQVRAQYVWPICDLRVDWDDSDPVGRLRALWREYEPQLEAYVTRALDPGAAPSFGVPGDE